MIQTKTFTSTKDISYSALAIVAGVLLPQIVHLAGGRALGNVLLPMHIPVLFAGVLLKRYWGAVCGILIPPISFFITSMPTMPRLFFMMIELGAYGFLAGLFYKKLKLPIFLSLILSMIGGRVLYFISITAIQLLGIQLAGYGSPWMAVTNAVRTGLPGIFLQLVFIPVVLYLLKKYRLIDDQYI